ncbi:MAG: prolipoprotein diacylglyceryl transferase [Bacteroidales bacterium]|nr:prolipoprotein diacylglyceryl transferase [Bacteroidales bacterium]
MTELFVYWNVSPVITHIGNIEVRWYGVLFAFAFVISYLMLKKLFAKDKVEQSYLDKLALYVFVAVLIGARLGHCLFYEFGYYSHHIVEMLLPIKITPDGLKFIGYQGLASHGGAIGILIALYIYSRNTKIPFMWVVDRLVIAICFAGASIRLGNLFNSEIYGVATQLPWGFVFLRDGQTQACHPTQLYEALSYIIIGCILFFIMNKKTKSVNQGMIFGLFLFGVFTMRFLIEFVKNSQESWENGMLINMGQILSLPFIIAGIVLIIIASKRNIGRLLDLSIIKKTDK